MLAGAVFFLLSWSRCNAEWTAPVGIADLPAGAAATQHAPPAPHMSAAWGALLARRLSQRGVLVFCLDYRNFPQARILHLPA